MAKPELFMLLYGLKKHIERGQWEDAAEIVDETLWAVADKDWKERQKAKAKEKEKKSPLK